MALGWKLTLCANCKWIPSCWLIGIRRPRKLLAFESVIKVEYEDFPVDPLVGRKLRRIDLLERLAMVAIPLEPGFVGGIGEIGQAIIVSVVAVECGIERRRAQLVVPVFGKQFLELPARILRLAASDEAGTARSGFPGSCEATATARTPHFNKRP